MANAKDFAAVLGGFVPAGVIMPFAGATVPAGWLLCDGSAVSRTTYAALAAALYDSGTSKYAWGDGDGVNSFHLPDLLGRFLRGKTTNSGRDPDYTTRTFSNTNGNTGGNVGSVQGDETGTHGHSMNYGYKGNGPLATGHGTGYVYCVQNAEANPPAYATVNNGGGTESRGKNANVNYIIKT